MSRKAKKKSSIEILKQIMKKRKQEKKKIKSKSSQNYIYHGTNNDNGFINWIS